MKIFSGTSNKPLAQKVAAALGIELSRLEVFVFPDGEKRIRILDKVLGEDIVIVQSTSNPTDENYMQLFFVLDALKRSGAKSIAAVVPYLGYQRQDHVFREGEAVSIKVIARILEKLGINKLITVDLHSIKIEEAFATPVAHLSALSIFAEEIKRMGKNTVLASPDMGGIRRIKILSELLGNMSYLTIEKNRDLASGKIIMDKINGQVMKNVVMVDDMISSGRTISMAADLLKKNGAENIYAFVTHAVFSEDAPKILSDSFLQKVFVTDTVSVSEEKRFPKLEILSVSELIARQLTD